MTASDDPHPRFSRLLPPGSPVEAAEALAGLDFSHRAPADRPHVVLNMVASVDGRVRVAGRSGALGGPGDHALFHALRRAVDAVMVGGGTARTEHYGPIVREPAGLPQPLACLVSGRLRLSVEDVPLLADPGSSVVVLTAAAGEVPGATARVEYLRSPPDGPVDLAAGLRALRTEHGVRSVLCEGGPSLNASLLAAGLVDELFLSLAPALAGGEDPLGIVAGALPGAPLALALRSVLEADGYLFLRYGVGAEPHG